MTLTILTMLIGCGQNLHTFSPSGVDADPDVVPHSESDTGFADVDVFTPEELAAAAFYTAFPEAEIVDSRDVYRPDGDFLGTLLVFSVDAQGVELEDAGDALFAGPDRRSILVAHDPDAELIGFETTGAPTDLLDDGALVYADADQQWMLMDDTDELFEPLTGEAINAAAFQPLERSAELIEMNHEERAYAESLVRQAYGSCGGNYGTKLSSYAGVSAYSNGGCTGTGSGTYQCVEYVKRLHTIMKAQSGNANTWDDAKKARKVNMLYSKNGGSIKPKAGDVVMSNGGSYGHIGALSAVGSTSATVIHQNWSSSSGTKSISRSGSTLGGFSSSYSIAGFLRPGWDLGNTTYDSTSSIYGWSLRNASITKVGSKAVTLNPGSDPGIVSPSGLNLNPNPSNGGYSKVRISMKSSAPDGTVTVYFTTSTSPSWSADKSEKASIKTNGKYKTLTVDMSVNGKWVYGGRVDQIRIDPANNGNSGSSDTIAIDKIWLNP